MMDAIVNYATAHQGKTLRLTEVYAAVGGSLADFHAALARVGLMEGMHLRTEADQKSLTDEDYRVQVVLGGSPRHTLLMEEPYDFDW